MSRDVPALTGPRLFAAASIAIAHFGIASAYQPFRLNLDIAALGMPLFFTLSGFIIHFVYAEMFQSAWRPALARFAWARFSRLYPLYFVLLAYFWAFSPPFHDLLADPRIGISFLTLTETWWYWEHGGQTIGNYSYGLSWSIATEWFFYLAYAAILYRVASIRSARLLLALLIGLCIAVYAVDFFVYFHMGPVERLLLKIFPDAVAFGDRVGNSAIAWLVYTSPYFRIWEFVGGVLTCQLYLTLYRSGRDQNWGAPLFWSGLLLVSALFLLYASVISPSLPIYRLMPLTSQYIAFLHNNFLLAPGMLLMILGLACGNNAGTRFMSLGIIVFGGEISYSIYLGQVFVGNLVPSPPEISRGLIIALDFFVTCIIAAGLYTVVEMPAKRMLRRLGQAATGVWAPSRVAVPAE
jgi:peptidoglycan/LPS O-acetylase OafA/YrhL